MTDSNHNRLEALPNVPLADLPLRPSSVRWWHAQGLRSTKEVEQGLQKHAHGSLIQWTQDLGAKSVGFLARLYQEVQQALETYTELRSNTLPVIFVRGYSAAQLLQEYQADALAQPTAVPLLVRSVDQLLGGAGLPVGEFTEICGPPGIGKTQWAMQLAINVQLPPAERGLQGSALYIDTEGSLTPERCHDMAQAMMARIHRHRRANPRLGPCPDWLNEEYLLAGIHVLRVYDVATLDATISTLPALCQAVDRPVRLVIIDSLAFPVRAESTNDFIGRTQQLTQWAMKLSQLAQQHPPKAVVALNQMTTTTTSSSHHLPGERTSSGNKENSLVVGSSLVPALGEAWAHAVTNRVILAPGVGDTRHCRLIKSPRLPTGQAAYTIAQGGIRDVGSSTTTISPAKRPRPSGV